jgi:hypothetical protein
MEYEGYGKQFIVANKMSPDAFVQVIPSIIFPNLLSSLTHLFFVGGEGSCS